MQKMLCNSLEKIRQRKAKASLRLAYLMQSEFQTIIWNAAINSSFFSNQDQLLKRLFWNKWIYEETTLRNSYTDYIIFAEKSCHWN